MVASNRSIHSVDRVYKCPVVSQRHHEVASNTLQELKDQAAQAPTAAVPTDKPIRSTAAAAAAPKSISSSNYSLLPDSDDGVSCLLLRVPKGWGTPRLQAFVERFGAKPKEVRDIWGVDLDI